MKEKKIFLNIHAEETNAPAATLQIREVKDTISKKVNECLTARGVVEVCGFDILVYTKKFYLCAVI